MTRRRKRKSGLEQILEFSWKEQLFLAAVAVACALLVPAVVAKSPILRPLAELISSFAWLAAVGLCGVALFKFVREKDSRPLSSPINREETAPLVTRETRESPDVTSSPSGVDTVCDESLKRTGSDNSTEKKPAKWSLELLREIEWKRFEILCGAYYAKRGFRVETIACGADGGIDAKLYFGRIKDPVGLVQCKAWGRLVGVKPVRELLGVMVHNKVARGIFHATGTFSDDALEFARTNKIQLISGEDLLANIRKLSQEAQDELLAVATEGDYRTPTCPSCAVKMRRISTKRGDFWGCTSYPRCKVKWNTAQLSE